MIKARRKVPVKQRWGTVFNILFLVFLTAAVLIAAQLIVGHAMLWTLGRETFSKTVPTAIYSVLSYVLAAIALIYLLPRVTRGRERKSGREDLGLKGAPTWTDIGLAPVSYIVYIILAAGVVGLFELLPWFNAGEAQDVGFSVYLVGGERVIAFLILVVVAPIFEEVIFRGWLYGKIREKLSDEVSEKVGILISSLVVSVLFGAVHMQWNVGVNVFAMSLVLCALREVTGTIYAGILMHMLKNGVAFYLLYIAGI